MDWNTTIIPLITVLGVFIANGALILPLFLWNRSESRADIRQLHEIQREDRKDLLQMSKNLETVLEAIQDECRDFHGRLCAIEERNRK